MGNSSNPTCSSATKSSVAAVRPTPDSTPKPSFAFMVPWPYQELGGVNQVVLNLAAECQREGIFQPFILDCCWDPERRPQTVVPVQSIRNMAICGDEGFSWSAALLYLAHLPRLLFEFRRIWRRNRVIGFNAHFLSLDCLHLILAGKLRLFRAPVLVALHGSDIRHAMQTRGLERTLYRWILRNADFVVACSEGLMQEALSMESRVRHPLVVRNGSPAMGSRTDSVLSPLPEAAESEEIILNVGRFEHRKGHDLIVRAFASVAAARPNARLWIAGVDGPTYDLTASQIANSGLSGRVRLFRDLPHDAIAPLMRRADVFVLASRWIKGVLGEGFPLAILEAGRLGLPVVSTRCCGADEILIDGENGRLVDLEDAAQLAGAISDLLENRALARELGANLQRVVCERFTMEQAWRLYREALAQSTVASFRFS